MLKKKKKQEKPRYRRNPLGFPLTEEDEVRIALAISASKKRMQTFGVYNNPPETDDEQNNTERGDRDTKGRRQPAPQSTKGENGTEKRRICK